ncbi:MAG: hypothetical protein LBG84_11530 [Treponema sp.]|jgi:hypothetical protein|nr:hypothetical protein [Treponema sp.]
MTKEFDRLGFLSTRFGFNTAVRHIEKTIVIMDAAGSKANVADLLYRAGDEEMAGERTALVLNVLLVDKLGYKVLSANLRSAAADLPSLAGEFAKWRGVDLVAAYHHPELGLLVANPKVSGELAAFGSLRRRELLVVYAGKGNSPADGDCRRAAELAVALFEGTRVKVPPALLRGPFTVRPPKPGMVPRTAGGAKPPRPTVSAGRGRKPGSRGTPPPVVRRAAPPVVTAAPAAAVPAGPVKMTPRYAVVVQNELFHNGNVEAWKRIVASYNARYPELQVYIYYDGERILDINALFKWGKVKHGSAIEFAVAGSEIKDVAKLQRYLAQGAGRQFEDFLQGPVSSALKLF